MQTTSLPTLEPAVLRVADACRYIGVGETTIYSLMKAGKLQFVKIGSRTGITRRSLDALIEANTRSTAAPIKPTPGPNTPKRGRGRPPKFPKG